MISATSGFVAAVLLVLSVALGIVAQPLRPPQLPAAGEHPINVDSGRSRADLVVGWVYDSDGKPEQRASVSFELWLLPFDARGTSLRISGLRLGSSDKTGRFVIAVDGESPNSALFGFLYVSKFQQTTPFSGGHSQQRPTAQALRCFPVSRSGKSVQYPLTTTRLSRGSPSGELPVPLFQGPDIPEDLLLDRRNRLVNGYVYPSDKNDCPADVLGHLFGTQVFSR